LKIFEVGVAKLVNVPLDQNEFDALVVFAYNCGVGEFGLGGSTLLKRINAGASMDQIEEAWLRFRKSTLDHDGKDNDNDGIIDEKGEKGDNTGLLNRRKSEFYLFKYGVNKFYN
jgi:lysozyme